MIEQETYGPCFEIVVQVRDKVGNPTGMTKILYTSDPAELADFFEQNTFKGTQPKNEQQGDFVKKKKPRKKKVIEEAAPIEKILKNKKLRDEAIRNKSEDI